jgi:hypothetical protein
MVTASSSAFSTGAGRPQTRACGGGGRRNFVRDFFEWFSGGGVDGLGLGCWELVCLAAGEP